MYYIDVNKTDTFCNYRDGNMILIKRNDSCDSYTITFEHHRCSGYDGMPEEVEYKIMVEVTPDIVCKYFKHLVEEGFGLYVESEFEKEERLRIKKAKQRVAKNLLS